MQIVDLGTMRYCDAWAAQERAHEEVLAGGEERILLVEHPPVITFGRRGRIEANVIAREEQLARMGVEVVHSDRGGDVTFHGPGQVVAYPIVRLAEHRLSVGCYVRKLELAMIAALAEFGISARKDDAGIGVWVDVPGGGAAKIGALGVRIRRGISLHGIALNVDTDLSYFDLIVPCGLAGGRVTSMRELLGDRTPPMDAARSIVAQQIAHAIQNGESCIPSPLGTGAREDDSLL